MNNINLLVLCLFIASCSHDLKKTSTLDIIDIPKALENQEDVKISEFIQGIEYIHLEETDQSLLLGPLIEVTDEYIIARNSGPSAMGPIILFDRETGKFIRTVGKSGRGPEEFQMGNSTIYNIYNKTLYGRGYNHDIKEYDLDGSFLGSFKLPLMIDEKVPEQFGTPSINLDQYLSSDIFVASINNSIGWDKRRIILFTRDSIIKVFPNYLFWERKDWGSSTRIGGTSFFRWNDNLSMKEVFNDTVFQITITSLIPRFVFLTGGHNPPPEVQGQIISADFSTEMAKYFLIGNIFENGNFLFFHLGYNKNSYTGFYNKVTKNTTICKLQSTNKSAFIDDINNFIPISPQKITQNNEMIYRLDPENILKWINENPEKAEALSKDMTWVNSILPTSNPVTIIAKFKGSLK